MKGTSMEKKKDDWLDSKALGTVSTQADFDRNRDGIYGGLPEIRLGLKIKGEGATQADLQRTGI